MNRKLKALMQLVMKCIKSTMTLRNAKLSLLAPECLDATTKCVIIQNEMMRLTQSNGLYKQDILRPTVRWSQPQSSDI